MVEKDSLPRQNVRTYNGFLKGMTVAASVAAIVLIGMAVFLV